MLADLPERLFELVGIVGREPAGDEREDFTNPPRRNTHVVNGFRLPVAQPRQQIDDRPGLSSQDVDRRRGAHIPSEVLQHAASCKRRAVGDRIGWGSCPREG
jgi:hypothetical protein